MSDHQQSSTRTRNSRVRQFSWRLPFLFLVLSAFALFLVYVSRGAAEESGDVISPADTAACLECHGDGMDATKLKNSAHGKLTCQECHIGVNQYPHPEQAVAKKPACAACHKQVASALAQSIHRTQPGKKNLDCAQCHGADSHTVGKLSTKAEQQAACTTCHAGIADALHKSIHAGAKVNCLDCHGGSAHGIAAPKNTAAACARCHSEQATTLAASAHAGRVTCTRCHGTNAHAIPAKENATGVCSTCHTREMTSVAGSMHGASSDLTCTSCHGSDLHGVAPPPRDAREQNTVCSTCHTGEAQSLTGMAHGQSGKGPLCKDCHGTHTHVITDPKRLTNAQRQQQCRQCHTDVAATLDRSAHRPMPGQPAGSLPSRALPRRTNSPARGMPTNRPDCLTCHGEKMHSTVMANQLTNIREDTCRKCHTREAASLKNGIHAAAGLKAGKPANCLSCHGSGPHAVAKAATTRDIAQGAACAACHPEQVQAYQRSTHARPDKIPGDHPTCISCHSSDIHGMARSVDLTVKQRVELCSKCHADAGRAKRYGLKLDAVTSYLQSFHGRAVMRFNKQNAATCIDCHGLHGIMTPDNPKASTGSEKVVATCGKCHPGSDMNFALSGANHLRLKIIRTPFLRILEIAFRTLLFGALSFLFCLVLLDLRRKLFCMDCSPACGRFICTLIAVSLLLLVGGIAIGFLGIPGSDKVWLVALALVAIAFILYSTSKKTVPPHEEEEAEYPRLNVVLRTQHILLASSFTLLVLTGFPLHFAEVQWTHMLLVPFGGFSSARVVHRVAGSMMVVNWVWHMSYLLLLWKRTGFSLKSWSMFPTWKDAVDLWITVKYGLGLSNEMPQFDRFQFREKFDYFADIWGTIVMGLSGFIMWFPVLANKYLPDVAFGAAYIAHSYEGMLALMAIIIWHFYNTHFNPDTFPMNPTWWTGKMGASEMEREHPLEKARLDAAGVVEKTGKKHPTTF